MKYTRFDVCHPVVLSLLTNSTCTVEVHLSGLIGTSSYPDKSG